MRLINSSIRFWILFFILFIIMWGCRENPSESEPGKGDAILIIESSPQRAAIFIDGLVTEKITPDSLENLYEGTYLVTLKLFGFRDTSISVTLEQAESRKVSVELEQIF